MERNIRENTVHGRMLIGRCSEGSGLRCPLAAADSPDLFGTHVCRVPPKR